MCHGQDVVTRVARARRGGGEGGAGSRDREGARDVVAVAMRSAA